MLWLPKIIVNTRTAEFIKYVNNSILAMQISFSNEMANLANKIKNIDYKDVLEEWFLIIDGILLNWKIVNLLK